jgi:hypothetical protein
MDDNHYRSGRAIGGGIVAGLIAGAVMCVMLVIAAVEKGGNIWQPLKGAATPFLHERAMQPGLDVPAIAAGLGCHFAIAAIWGALFGVLAYGLSRGLTVVAGAVWGIVVWIGMYYVVLPLAGMGDVPRHVPIAQAIISHVVFGLIVSFGFLPFQRTRPHAPAVGAH